MIYHKDGKKLSIKKLYYRLKFCIRSIKLRFLSDNLNKIKDESAIISLIYKTQIVISKE